MIRSDCVSSSEVSPSVFIRLSASIMLNIRFTLLLLFLTAISQGVLANSRRESGTLLRRRKSPRNVNREPSNDVQSSRECFCTYDYENSFVKARLGHKTLKQGDTIMRGQTVSFECRYVNKVLTWQNGLRFFGKANMTCRTCEIWQSNDLPGCKQVMKIDAVVGCEEDLAVLPGGTVDVRKGESRRFFCSSIWRQPKWNYSRKNGISVIETEDRGQEESIYISYLDITNAEDKHSGKYDCFIQGATGHRIGYTFLHLQVTGFCNVPVVENGELGIFQTRDTRRGHVEEFRKVPPGENVNSGQILVLRCRESFFPVGDSEFFGSNLLEVTCSDGSWSKVLQCEETEDLLPTLPESEVLPTNNVETTSAPNDRECLCTYYQYSFVKAQIGHKILKQGDTIKQGETVSFECSRVNRILTWHNGLRFYGKANITCNNCEEWHNEDPPMCHLFSRDDVFISSEEDLTIQPGGIVTIRKGDRLKFSCVSPLNYPQWEYDVNENILEFQNQVYRNGKTFFISNLEIMQAEDEHSGKYECFGNIDVRPVRSTSLELQVNDFVSCSRFPISWELQVTYSNGVSVGSIARFSCTSSTESLTGGSYSICQENGSWSSPLPSCEDFVGCSGFPISQELQVTYSNDVSVGSIARFSCTSSTTSLIGSSFSICQENGSWSNPLPSCQDFVSCSKFPISRKLQVTYSNDVSVGSIARFSCASSTRSLTGGSYSICQENGSWSSPLPSCEGVQGCQLNLDPTSHLLVEPIKNGYRIGDSVSLSCPPGEHIPSNVQKLMCLSRGWSDDLPQCKKSEQSDDR